MIIGPGVVDFVCGDPYLIKKEGGERERGGLISAADADNHHGNHFYNFDNDGDRDGYDDHSNESEKINSIELSQSAGRSTQQHHPRRRPATYHHHHHHNNHCLLLFVCINLTIWQPNKQQPANRSICLLWSSPVLLFLSSVVLMNDYHGELAVVSFGSLC